MWKHGYHSRGWWENPNASQPGRGHVIPHGLSASVQTDVTVWESVLLTTTNATDEAVCVHLCEVADRWSQLKASSSRARASLSPLKTVKFMYWNHSVVVVTAMSFTPETSAWIWSASSSVFNTKLLILFYFKVWGTSLFQSGDSFPSCGYGDEVTWFLRFYCINVSLWDWTL